MTADERSLPARTARTQSDATVEGRHVSKATVDGDAVGGTAAISRHVTDDFLLPDEILRDPKSGRWNARQIAEALGISSKEFDRMVGGNDGAIRQTIDGADHQDRLAPIANVLAMVSDYYGGDLGRVRTWLTQPQTRLGGRSPIDALGTRRSANAMEQWVAGLWLGDGE